MSSPYRRRVAVFVLPLVIVMITARHAAAHVRTVDFITLFASGVVFGVSLMGLVQMWKARGSPTN